MVEGVAGEAVLAVRSVPEPEEAEEQLREGEVGGPGERTTRAEGVPKMEEGACRLGEEAASRELLMMVCGSQEVVVVSCQLEEADPSWTPS